MYPVGGYRDYVGWLAGQDQDESDRVWRQELAGLPGPSLVAEGHTPSERFADIAAEPADDIDIAARSAGVPLSVAVHSAWAVTLGGILRGRDVVFGSTVSGRDAEVPGIRDMVGLFINTIPVRARWAATDTAYDLLAAVKEHESAVLAHQHVSLARIGRQSGAGSLFDTLVVFDVATDVDALRGPDDTLTIADIVNEGAPHYPLTLVVEQSQDGRPRFNLIYDGELLRRESAEAILSMFTRTLTELLSRPDALVDALTPEADSAPEQVAPTTLGELFDTAAHRDPAATAVTQCALDGSTRSMTYGELRASKDELASALRAAGVRPGRRVAVAVSALLEQVVALVAVVTAGGAYVPLDLAYPDERLEYILADAAPRSSSWTGNSATASPGCWSAPEWRPGCSSRVTISRRPTAPRPGRGRRTRRTSSTPPARPAGPRASLSRTRRWRRSSPTPVRTWASARTTSSSSSTPSPSTSPSGSCGAPSRTAASCWCRSTG
ncbi:Non-ribosomal peptide synthetase OS=Streptomyces microflavus OX=1919 GN=Smic_00960 PE=4 SV=1 [Streptomyces microflavus]